MSIYDSYVFRADDPAGANMRRIVKTQLTGALRTIGSGKPVPEKVHEVRKRCKAIRGVYRLARPVLKDASVYKRDNGRVRDAARRLSDSRDRRVSLDLCEDLIARPPTEDVAAAAASLRARLLDEVSGTQATEGDAALALEEAAEILRAVRKDVDDWRLAKKGYAAVGPGIERSYGGGYDALATVRADMQTEALHALRKRVKDHGYHLRLLMPVWRPVLRARYAEADRLTDLIGQDHDIAVLVDLAGAEHGEPHMDAALHYFREWRTVLQRDALRLAGRLYAEPPPAFRKRIGHYWNSWQAEAA